MEFFKNQFSLFSLTLKSYFYTKNYLIIFFSLKYKKMSEEALNANDMESYEPEARWTCEDTDTTIMTERIRFPYASSVIAPNRFMKSAMSEQVNNYCQFSFLYLKYC